jgi:hypothetical protein
MWGDVETVNWVELNEMQRSHIGVGFRFALPNLRVPTLAAVIDRLFPKPRDYD